MRNYISFLLFIFFASNIHGQDVLSKPDKYYSVVDIAQLLNSSQYSALTQKLDDFKLQTGNELVVVIVPSLGSLTIEEYANTLFNNWGIGQKEKNNGILLLIAVKDRKMRIESGYGVEDKITDIYASFIIENSLKPNFRKALYYEGIEAATNDIISSLYSGFNLYKHQLKTIEPIQNNTAVDLSNSKGIVNPKLVFYIVFFAQLIFGLSIFFYAKFKKLKDVQMPIIKAIAVILLICIILGYAIIFKTNYIWQNMNYLMIIIFFICCFHYVSYLFSEATKVFVSRFLYSTLNGSIFSFIIYVFSQSILFFIILSIVFSALIYYLIKTGKFNFSSFGSSGRSGGSSGGSSGYGGGSSGGGGASGSW
jgi:uncharacterized protein